MNGIIDPFRCRKRNIACIIWRRSRTRCIKGPFVGVPPIFNPQRCSRPIFINCSSLFFFFIQQLHPTPVTMLCTPLRFFSILPAELSLATVLRSGQSFRWHKFEQIHATRPDPTTGALSSSNAGVKKEDDEGDKLLLGEEFAMGWRDRTIVLRQDGEWDRKRREILYLNLTSCRIFVSTSPWDTLSFTLSKIGITNGLLARLERRYHPLLLDIVLSARNKINSSV